MQPTDTVWFKSKLDPWIAVVLVLVPLAQFVALLQAISSGERDGLIAGLFGLAFVAGIYLLVVVPVRYGIASDALLVHFGVVRQRIQFDSIREIRPTRALWSSAALSIDRLAIRTGRGPLGLTLISPVRRDEFIGLLSSRANLTWDGKRWARREDSSRV